MFSRNTPDRDSFFIEVTNCFRVIWPMLCMKFLKNLETVTSGMEFQTRRVYDITMKTPELTHSWSIFLFSGDLK